MKDTLLSIVNAIVDNPDKVEIKEEEVEGVTNFTITVAPEDMGKIIGKGGKVIRAIRTVMKIPAIKANKRIFVSLTEIPQVEGSEMPQP
ncbi:MAG TPA: KH domain-containing protein [Patescibacteria group bacterium]|jgi:hypothetical protein|nr:KH domain-containing protein [Patescibacteria group bacterium]